MCILFLMILGWVSVSAAATATISLDWSSIQADLYKLPLDGGKIANYGLSEAYSYVEAWNNDDVVSDETYSGADIDATLSSASAFATSNSLDCELSLSGGEGETGTFAERIVYSTPPETSLLMVSIDYAWDFSGFTLGLSDYIEAEFYLELYTWDEENGRYSESFSSDYESIYFSMNSALSSGSGTLTVYTQLPEGQDFELYFAEELEGSMELTGAPTPIPGSLMMLFTGLGCLAAINRKK